MKKNQKSEKNTRKMEYCSKRYYIICGDGGWWMWGGAEFEDMDEIIDNCGNPEGAIKFSSLYSAQVFRDRHCKEAGEVRLPSIDEVEVRVAIYKTKDGCGCNR